MTFSLIQDQKYKKKQEAFQGKCKYNHKSTTNQKNKEQSQNTTEN